MCIIVHYETRSGGSVHCLSDCCNAYVMSPSRHFIVCDSKVVINKSSNLRETDVYKPRLYDLSCDETFQDDQLLNRVCNFNFNLLAERR